MCMHLSVIGLVFIQGVLVAIAIVYKLLFNTKLMGADIIYVVESLFYYFAIPVFAYLVFSLAGTSISFIYFVINERVKVSKICILFNPLVMFGVGELLKLTKIHYLVDFAAAMIPFGSRPRSLKVSAQTRRARVESRPPEIPTTTVRAWT